MPDLVLLQPGHCAFPSPRQCTDIVSWSTSRPYIACALKATALLQCADKLVERHIRHIMLPVVALTAASLLAKHRDNESSSKTHPAVLLKFAGVLSELQASQTSTAISRSRNACQTSQEQICNLALLLQSAGALAERHLGHLPLPAGNARHLCQPGAAGALRPHRH